MMKNLQIRQATVADLAALQTIGRQTFAQTYADGNTVENMVKYLAEGFSEEKLGAELQNENSQFYFALQKEKVIGYLKVNTGDAQSDKQDPSSLEIERIYVLQEYQGKRVGFSLYQQALAIALERKSPYIWLGVWEKNPNAMRFYQKQGFVEFDQHIFQLGEDAQTDILMRLNLNTSSPNTDSVRL
jgi:ribosomal protein S18 acetylase RimI-like enzyme